MSGTEKIRRRTHLPRDAQGFVRLQWLENFFETLYASNERINVPYTVVFQYRRIYAAYFTDSDGYVQKIDKIADLGPEQVMEGLKSISSKRTPSMARAFYTYSKKSDDTFPFSQESVQDLSVEYFDDASLANFLTYRSKENNGILQQFLEPLTVNVSSIRAYWTQHFCHLETRMNVNKADDTHISIQRRAVTFEGEHHHSQPFPLSSKIEGRLRSLIALIVENVKNCLPSNVGIQMMMLNFKVGEKGKIWFLYCNALKLFDQSLTSIGYGRDSQGLRPSSARLVEASIPPPGVRGSKKRCGVVCPSSETRLGPFDKYKVTVQQIFAHFLWHGPSEAWIKLNRPPPNIPLEFGKDPGVSPNILRHFLTMDLRLSPTGVPFFWNAPLDKTSARERDVWRWSTECKEAHRQLEKSMDEFFLENTDAKAMYRFWEATMVYLISQEIDSLTQENFKQERIRPSFLQSELHCCEQALLVYNATYEEILEEQRKELYKPLQGDKVLWGRLGASVKDIWPQGKGASELRRDLTSASKVVRLALGSDQNSRESALSAPHSVHFQQTPRKVLYSDQAEVTRVTRRMLSAVLLGATASREPEKQHPSQDGLRSGRLTVPYTPRSQGSSNSLPSVLIDANLVSQLEGLRSL